MLSTNQFNVKVLVLWILALSILLISCNSSENSGAAIGQNDKKTSSTNNIPISILFSNANLELPNIQPQNITVNIKDDSQQLRTSENVLLARSIQGTITIKNNQLKLQLPKKAIQKWFSFRTTTYSFVIQANAKGFKPIKQKITITSKDLLGKKVEIPMEYNGPLSKKTEYIPIAVQFISIDNKAELQPKGLKVNLRDSLGHLITAGNQSIPKQKSIYLKGNKINFKLPISVIEKKSNNIYTFSIYAETENFLPITQKVVIKDKKGTYQPIYMLPDIERGKIDKLPEGVAMSGQKIELRDAKIEKEIIINSAESEILIGKNNFEVNVTLPAGTELRNEFNKPIRSNNAFAKLTTMDTRFDIPRNSFPNGYLVTAAKTRSEEGRAILASPNNPKFFSIFSYFDLSIKANGEEEIKNLSTPAKLTASLKPLNEKETAFNAEDQVALWYLEDSTGTWIREQVTNIRNGEKGLEAEFIINHLSYYAIGILIDACINPLQVNLNGIDNSLNVTRAFRATYNNNSGTFLGLLNLPSDESFKVLIPQVSDLKIELLESMHYSSPSLVASLPYSSMTCSNNDSPLPALSLSVPPQSQLDACEIIEFKIICPDSCVHPNNIPLLVNLNDGPTSTYTGSFNDGVTYFDTLMIENMNIIKFELIYDAGVDMFVNTSLLSALATDTNSPFFYTSSSVDIDEVKIKRFPQHFNACKFRSRFEITIDDCQAFFRNNSIGTQVTCN